MGRVIKLLAPLRPERHLVDRHHSHSTGATQACTHGTTARLTGQEYEQPTERHSYLKLEDRPTLRALPAGIPEPPIESGAVVLDSGKWWACPAGGEPLGHHDTIDAAQLELAEFRRSVAMVARFAAWACGLGDGR